MTGKNKKWIKREIEVHRELSAKFGLHQVGRPSIVKLYHVLENSKYLVLVTELCEPLSLHQYVQSQPGGTLSEMDAREFFLQIVTVFDKFRSFGFVHRDAKPSNLFLKTERGKKVIRVGDFGNARKVDDTFFGQEKPMRAFMGNRGTTPPEMFKLMLHEEWPEFPGYTSKVDVYALGIIFFWMIVGCVPFDRHMVNSDIEFARLVLKG